LTELVASFEIDIVADEHADAYGSLLPLEGEGEDEGRSKATHAYRHKPITSIRSLWKGRGGLCRD